MTSDTETYTDRCDALRARGNVLYGEVAAGGGGNAAGKRGKLQRAQELYKEALELSCDSDKRASCCKNLGALHYLWGKVELEMTPSWMSGEEGSAGSAAPGGGLRSSSPSIKLSGVTEHLGQAISFLVRAYVEGARAGKPDEWMEQVGGSLAGLVTWAAEQSQILAFPGAPIVRSVCEDLAKVGRNNLAFKVEAEALANVELAICLSQYNPDCEEQQQVLVNGIPAAIDRPLSRARRLLQGLPPSTTNARVHERINDLNVSLLNRPSHNANAIFEQFFGTGSPFVMNKGQL